VHLVLTAGTIDFVAAVLFASHLVSTLNKVYI
jgi:hypothetical protein